MGDFIWLLVNLIVFQEKVDSWNAKYVLLQTIWEILLEVLFLIEWSDTYHWFIYREALPSQPQFTTPQKFSGASSFCRCSASPRRPTCRPQRLPQFTDPRLPTGRQYAGGSGHDPLQGSTRRWHCAYWHWLLAPVHARGKAGGGKAITRMWLLHHHPSSLHLQHSFKPWQLCSDIHCQSPRGHSPNCLIFHRASETFSIVRKGEREFLPVPTQPSFHADLEVRPQKLFPAGFALVSLSAEACRLCTIHTWVRHLDQLTG